MPGERHEAHEKPEREGGHDGLAADAPETVIVQQVPEWRHEPALADVMPFHRELPEKPSWHYPGIPFR
jgi:hypothetical protein